MKTEIGKVRAEDGGLSVDMKIYFTERGDDIWQ